MSEKTLTPANNKALAEIWEEVRSEVTDLEPGRSLTIIVAKDRNGCISVGGSYIERRRYPLEDRP